MFIFGWGRVTNKKFGATMAVSCPNCNNETWLELSRLRRWFTWFFIPVIPYSSKHLLTCSVCSQGVELAGEQIKQAKELNQLTIGLFNEEISQDDYRAQAEKIEVFG